VVTDTMMNRILVGTAAFIGGGGGGVFVKNKLTSIFPSLAFYDTTLDLKVPTELLRTNDGDGDGDDQYCMPYNYTYQLTADFCSLLTLSRLSSNTMATALERAEQCLLKTSSECVLSFEIGLALPAAFINDHKRGEIVTVIAPKLIELSDEHTHQTTSVRASNPRGQYRDYIMNTSIYVEYMNENRHLEKTVFHNDSAYCIQLLRLAYINHCWISLD
jgi:hypothetical protein